MELSAAAVGLGAVPPHAAHRRLGSQSGQADREAVSINRDGGEVQCMAPGRAGGVRRDTCPSHVRTAVWTEASTSAGPSFSEDERPRKQRPDTETLLEACFQNEQAPSPRQDLRSQKQYFFSKELFVRHSAVLKNTNQTTHLLFSGALGHFQAQAKPGPDPPVSPSSTLLPGFTPSAVVALEARPAHTHQYVCEA